MKQDQNLEQVAAVIREAEAIFECHPSKDARAFANSAAIVMKTQKERIAELEKEKDRFLEALKHIVGCDHITGAIAIAKQALYTTERK